MDVKYFPDYWKSLSFIADHVGTINTILSFIPVNHGNENAMQEENWHSFPFILLIGSWFYASVQYLCQSYLPAMLWRVFASKTTWPHDHCKKHWDWWAAGERGRGKKLLQGVPKYSMPQPSIPCSFLTSILHVFLNRMKSMFLCFISLN